MDDPDRHDPALDDALDPDGSITPDPDGPADGAATASGSHGPRGTTERAAVRARRVAVVGILSALVAAGVAVQQRTVADAWRDRTVAVELQRDEAIGRAEALTSQLDELVELQATTSSELEGLTGRLAELAGEKADAEDRALVTEAQRDAAGRVAQQVASAVRGLDACIIALLELRAATVDAFNRVARGESVDVAPLNARSDATIAQCQEARRAAAAAGSAASALG